MIEILDCETPEDKPEKSIEAQVLQELKTISFMLDKIIKLLAAKETDWK